MIEGVGEDRHGRALDEEVGDFTGQECDGDARVKQQIVGFSRRSFAKVAGHINR